MTLAPSAGKIFLEMEQGDPFNCKLCGECGLILPIGKWVLADSYKNQYDVSIHRRGWKSGIMIESIESRDG